VNDDDGFFVATVRTGKGMLEMTPQIEQLMQRASTRSSSSTSSSSSR
jgi:ATP-dependent Lon protease